MIANDVEECVDVRSPSLEGKITRLWFRESAGTIVCGRSFWTSWWMTLWIVLFRPFAAVESASRDRAPTIREMALPV